MYGLTKIILILFLFVQFVFAKDNTTLKIALPYGGRSQDAHKHTDSSTLAITKQIYSNLFVIDSNSKLVPELAEKYEVSKEGGVIITLKKSVYFHDGTEVTAEEVKKSLERNKTIPITKVLVDPLEKIEALDKLRLKISSKTNYKIILHNLTHSSLAIVKDKGNGELVGSGPFKLAEWGTGQKVTLVRNEKYFKGMPKVEKVQFFTIPEATNRHIALETGEIHIAYDISALDMKTLEKSKDLMPLNVMSFGTDFLSINTSKAPLSDAKLRQAISYAIDRDAINEVIFENTASVATSVLTPNTFGYYSTGEYKNNLEKAKEIMKEYKTPIDIELWIYEDTSKFQTAQLIQNDLRQIGINAKIMNVELSSLLRLTAQGKHDALVGLWYTSTGDADYGLYPLLHKDSRGAVGNRSFYDNPEVSSLLDQGRYSKSDKERVENYKKVQEIVSRENPIVPLVYKMFNIGMNKSVKGFKYNPNGNHILENVYIEN